MPPSAVFSAVVASRIRSSPARRVAARSASCGFSTKLEQVRARDAGVFRKMARCFVEQVIGQKYFAADGATGESHFDVASPV